MPFDGHALAAALIQAEIMIDRVIDTVFDDRSSYGHDFDGAAEVHLVGQKRISRSLMIAV